MNIRKCPARGHHRGFTLIELLVTIAIGAILISLTAPSFRDFIHNNRITAYTNDFVAAFNLARSEAIKRGAAVSVSIYTGTNWGDGWVVWVDTDADNTRSEAETLRIWEVAGNLGTIESLATATRLQYLSNGAIDTSDTFKVCNTSVNNSGRRVAIAATGRLTTTTIDCSV